jgi:hypothetical protein
LIIDGWFISVEIMKKLTKCLFIDYWVYPWAIRDKIDESYERSASCIS